METSREDRGHGALMPQGPALARRLGLALVLVFLAVGILAAWGLDYLLHRGLPLDDAWIHAVYGRELLRNGSLAYNPGEPTTGETAPLWAVFVAAAHLVASRPETVLLAIKGIGLTLHAAVTVGILLGALGAKPGSMAAFGGGLLVATNPDLLAASVAGMEVSLASLLSVLLFAAVRRGRALPVLVAASLAPLARPELALLSLVFPALLHFPDGRGALRRTAAAAAAGTALCYALLSLRNYGWSGLPLPATFYAKFARSPLSVPGAEGRGFGVLLPSLGFVTHPAILAGLLFLAWAFALSHRDEPGVRLSAAAITGAVLFFAVSFVAAPPVDPGAFYHQRYVLPVLVLILASIPPLAARLLQGVRSRLNSIAVGIVTTALVVLQLAKAPGRFARHENDARNIDDVQVAVGKSLSGARPDQQVWAVDAGAIRYFGDATVVDMFGLNAPEVLRPGTDAYLQRRPPSFLVEVPGWSTVIPAGGSPLPSKAFFPSTPYTVTSYPAMSVHRLYNCRPGLTGVFARRDGMSFPFACATDQASGKGVGTAAP